MYAQRHVHVDVNAIHTIQYNTHYMYLFVNQKYYTNEKREQEQKRIAWGIRNPQLRK